MKLIDYYYIMISNSTCKSPAKMANVMAIKIFASSGLSDKRDGFTVPFLTITSGSYEYKMPS